MMPAFDFISHVAFRRSLETDYADLLQCYKTSAWKSVLVLAGSIVEALLVDYLVATHAKRGGKDPLRMDLAEAVALCKSEEILTERTADLCSVVRSYRNLIHPGRTVRLRETPPNGPSAQIAIALVDLIVEEVATTRKAAFGLTAEQILSKIERDPDVSALLQHLLREVNDTEKLRIVLELLPERYLALYAQDQLSPEEYDLLQRLSSGFHVVLDQLPESAHALVSSRFVEIVKSADGATVSTYAKAFFRANHLRSVQEAHVPLVREFLLSKMSPLLDLATLEMVDGIETYLSENDAGRWIDPIVRTLTSSSSTAGVKESVQTYFEMALWDTSIAFDHAVLRRLNHWESSLRSRNASAAVGVIEQLKAYLPPLPPEDEETDDLQF